MCHKSVRMVCALNTPNRAARLPFVNNVFGHHR